MPTFNIQTDDAFMNLDLRVRPTQKIKDNQTLSPLLERIFSARGVASVKQLNYGLKQLIHPDEIYQLTSCAAFIAAQIQLNTSILIVGDYDADGATSTALMMKGLALLGATQLDYVLPDRVNEGYGLSSALVARIIEKAPQLVITVDTGISNIEGIETLRGKKIDVVVTDHHLAAEQLPNANFIINPNAYSKDISPNGRCLAGVGVAFYVLLAVRIQLRKLAYFNALNEEPNLACLLDYVALGTVADLVPLDHLNRVLVKQGLALIQKNQCCEGIQQLFAVSGKQQKTANHQDLGFAIAPKINAAGRIDNMVLGVQCLLATGVQARHYAQQLNDINEQRRALQADMKIDSDDMLKQLQQGNVYPKGIVLSHPDWHEGIVGIVASQIKQKTYRPVFVFAQADNGLLKGSGRSIAGIHLRDMLDLMDKRNKGLIVKFGGHAMAAGLSINAEKFDVFKQVFNDILQDQFEEHVFLQNSLTDGALSDNELSLDTAEEIHAAGPWGQCFEEPIFMGVFKVLQQRVLKEKHLKLVLANVNNEDATIDGIHFFCDEALLNRQFDQVKICYRLSINEFRSQKTVQLIISELRPD